MLGTTIQQTGQVSGLEALRVRCIKRPAGALLFIYRYFELHYTKSQIIGLRKPAREKSLLLLPKLKFNNNDNWCLRVYLALIS